MLKGEMVRCKHWSGALKYKINEQTLLQAHFGVEEHHSKWETSNLFLSYEDFIDYEIFNWHK